MDSKICNYHSLSWSFMFLRFVKFTRRLGVNAFSLFFYLHSEKGVTIHFKELYRTPLRYFVPAIVSFQKADWAGRGGVVNAFYLIFYFISSSPFWSSGSVFVLLAERMVFETRQRLTEVCKIGSDSSTAKLSWECDWYTLNWLYKRQYAWHTNEPSPLNGHV